MNACTFTARLGSNAELRTLQSGDKVLGFSAASDVGYGDKRTTLWLDCSLWGKRAEVLAPHLAKGQFVVVTGEVSLREFKRRDGSTGTTLGLRVAEIDLGPRAAASAAASSNTAPSNTAPSTAATGPAPAQETVDLDDEIPW